VSIEYPKSRRGGYLRYGEQDGFSLVEVIVAIAVLALIVLILNQMFSGSSVAISQSNEGIGALDASQAVFQQIGSDVSRMLLRDDVDYSFVKNAANTPGNLAGNDTFSFYARTTGLASTGSVTTGTPRALSVVQYQIATNANNNQELDYGALQIDWDNSGSTPFVLTSATQLLTPPNTLPTVSSFTTLAPEVIRMEICFQLFNDPNGNATPQLLTITPPVYVAASPAPTGTKIAIPRPIRNVAGILVGIVVIDPKSRLLLPVGTDLKVAQLFPDAAANEDLLSLWTPDNTPAKLEAAGVPVKAVSGVRIYQKYFPLPW
jgi:prepilin-type N-terminal cleavage/methylation domain-containing protein